MAPMKTVKLGAQVPDFKLEGTSRFHFHLKTQRGQIVVLYFYPKDATSGCTMQGQDFKRLKASFAKAGTVVFGISRDSLKSHEKFKEKEAFNFELLSDEDEIVCPLFDVIREKNMYGRKVMGIERSTFIIDAEGVLTREWRKVKVAGHADEVLAVVQAMSREARK